MYFCHNILTVPQNTQRCNFHIIPECYSVFSVIFTIFASPGVCFVYFQTDRAKFVHPVEFFIVNLYFDQNFTVTVSTLALFCHLVFIL